MSGLLAAIAVSTVLTTAAGLLQPWFITTALTPRGQAIRQLHEIGGKHLVFVHYSPHHEFHYGVVFNDANIDRSDIIWAHQIEPESDKLLAQHYRDRNVWLFNPDESPVTLVPFTDKPYLSSVVPGAGRRDDTQQGVSPGSIAILLGSNFTRGGAQDTEVYPFPHLPFRLISASAEWGDLFAPETSRKASRVVSVSNPGISVMFGPYQAPVLAVSRLEDQEAVTVQVPFELPPGETLVTLRDVALTSTRKVTILPASPGIFQMRESDGEFRGIVMRPDGSVVDVDYPAHPGEVLRMFATGLGPMLPPVRTRQPTAGAGAVPVNRLIVGVNHQGAPLLSARYLQGMAGVEEVVFRVPLDVPPSRDIPLSLGVVVGGRTVYSNKSRLPVR